MEAIIMNTLESTQKILLRIFLLCFICMTAATTSIAAPDEWNSLLINSSISSWNFYDDEAQESFNTELNAPVVSLSCIPLINVSLNQQGFAVITGVMLVNAPDYPANQYVVDIMGPLTNTVTCANIGQELMAVVTELPTGNSCMSTLNIEDKLPPVFACQADFLPCNTDIPSIDFENYLEPVTDNCDNNPTLWYSFVAENLPCNPNNYTKRILVTWTATDDYGNSSTCVDTIYLVKPSIGQVIFPPDVSISCVNANTDPSNTGEPTYAGEPIDHACQFVSFFNDVQIPMCNGAYKLKRTWTVMDWCTGSQATDVQEILIVDNNKPEIACPPNITVGTDFQVCTTKYTLPMPVVSDLCADDNQIAIEIRVTGIPGIFQPGQMVNLGIGTSLITMKAIDPCGNTRMCQYSVTVQDNLPPIIACPGNVTIQCEGSTDPGVTGYAIAIDVCDDSPEVHYVDATIATDGCAFGYIITRTWTAEDESGNVSTCMQMIELTDNTPPTIFCPVNVTITCTESTDVSNTGLATASDFCDVSPDVTYNDQTQDGSCPQAYMINRTWTATDDCGNTSTCLQIINVVDNIPPEITCPDDITIMCIESSNPNDTGTATATDSCDNDPIISSNDNIVPGIQELTIERTWTAEDHCGNSTTCLQLILVRDDTPPVITCPDDITIECGTSTDPMVTGTATSIDNCDDDPGESYEDSFVPGPCPQENIIERLWTATDECGNTSTCLQIITIDDSTPPLITCPVNITIECDEDSTPENTGSASATDNCDSAPVIDFADVISDGACLHAYSINRTWTATDACGNVSTCVQIINVEDTTAPDITCPGNTTIQCDESTVPENTGFATATDNCDNDPLISFNDSTSDGDCPEEYTITRIWTAEDDCGNSTTCVQIILVVDTTPPTITFCASNTTIECDESTAPANTGVSTATDNCDTAPTVEFEDVTMGGECPHGYTITRTWTATDACGNGTNCIQVITIEDTTPPTITCPDNTTIECGDNPLPANTGFATAVDNCDTAPEIGFSDVSMAGACPQEYTINRTWTATDVCGNSSTCVQTIFVDDSTPPVITCPLNMTIECDDSTDPLNTGFATATDNCTTGPLVTFEDTSIDGGCPQSYTIVRTWSSSDACGNSASCEQVIQVLDSTPPVITCPVDITIACSESTDPINTGMATAIDNCDNNPIVSFEDTVSPGGCSGEGGIVRLWTATDACGNTSTCAQLISIMDDLAPGIICPSDVTISCTASTLPANTGTATATDNCDDNPTITFADVTISGDCPVLLTISRTWTATDACGNSSSCLQTIVVTDNDTPLITCPADITIECDENTLPDNTGTAIATDECSVPVITFEDVIEGSGCAQESFIFRTWTATDGCGHSSSCQQIISIIDSTAPEIDCPANVTVQCNESTSPEDTGQASAEDNCDDAPIINFSDVTVGSGCPDGYIITRTWTAADRCGNISSCDQIITVDDNIAPVINCPANITVECNDSTSPDNTGVASATDICDASPGIDFTDEIIDGLCPQVFTITRTWIATDNCGNTGTCNQTISVEDNIAPICVAVDITIELGANNMFTIQGSDVDGGSSDACGPVTLSVSPSTFDCDDLGANPVVLTVTDCSGNTSTCDAIVTVHDNNSLVAICQNITIFLDENGNASIDPEDIDNGSGGGCVPGDLTFELDQTEFDCSPLGGIEVTLTVTDEEGNTATCTAIVTVVDAIPPTITCPPNVTVACNTVTDPNDTNQFGLATSMDNCPPAPIVETHVINLNDCGVGTIVRTFVATDGSGNTASCVQIVTVNNPNPFTEDDITWPDEVSNVDICNSTDPQFIPNGEPIIDPAAFLCANPVVSFEDEIEFNIDNDPQTPCRIITRTWTVVDDCQPNGTFEFVQTINVIDAVPPLFTNINDMQKAANQNCVAPFTIIASATDCAGVTITNDSPYGVNSGANASGNYPIGVTVVIFTATDGCGNTSTMDVVITVTDPNPTQMQCEKQVVFLPFETEITLPGDTFVIFLQGNCSNGDDFIISFSGTNPFDTLHTYDCGDVGVSTFSLWMWTLDGTMLVDSCETADLDLRDPLDYCGDGFAMSGTLQSEQGKDITDVEVSIMNAPMVPDTSNESGQYTINGLNKGIGYGVTPHEDRNHRKGVSTLDLVLIQKHLLGKELLNSPYKIIAADANHSGSVTALDLLEIRKLILGIYSKFPNNTSWRFIERQYDFQDPYNPFAQPFPEYIWVDSVTRDIDRADFIGLKVGDVNGSFFLTRANGQGIEPRSTTDYELSLSLETDPASGQKHWAVKSLSGQGKISGMQFSIYVGGLSAREISEISSDLLSSDQLYFDPNTSMINVSWSLDREEDISGRTILSIPDNGDKLDISFEGEAGLEPEAYAAGDGEIEIRKINISLEEAEAVASSDYHLYQNIPNPFSESTSIKYALPGQEKVTIVIHDVTGRQIYSKQVLGNAGMNEILIQKDDIGISGIYYYTLYTLNASFTHKMSFTND